MSASFEEHILDLSDFEVKFVDLRLTRSERFKIFKLVVAGVEQADPERHCYSTYKFHINDLRVSGNLPRPVKFFKDIASAVRDLDLLLVLLLGAKQAGVLIDRVDVADILVLAAAVPIVVVLLHLIVLHLAAIRPLHGILVGQEPMTGISPGSLPASFLVDGLGLGLLAMLSELGLAPEIFGADIEAAIGVLIVLALHREGVVDLVKSQGLGAGFPLLVAVVLVAHLICHLELSVHFSKLL